MTRSAEAAADARAGEARLLRAIGLPALTASIVNQTIGAGIFVLPAIVAGGLGPAAAKQATIKPITPAQTMYASGAAGSRVSLTGGLYAYIEVAFGPFVGFLSGALYWLMASFAVASVASAFAGSIGALTSIVDNQAARGALLASLFGALAFVNVRGVRSGSRVVQVVTVAKLLPLAILVVSGIWSIDPDALRWPGPPSLAALGRTSIILIFAFAGVEIAVAPAGEIRDPTRTVPRAIFTALAITTTFYLLIQVVAQGLLGSSLTNFASAPLAEAASRVLGATGRATVLVGGAVSMFGYISGDMLGSPRVLYAFGRDGTLPEPFRRVHPVFRTPHVAIAFYAIVVATLAISGTFAQLAILANVSALTLYGTAVAAAAELQRRNVRSEGAPLRLPGGLTIPLLAIGMIVWLLSHATRRELAVEAIVLGIAAAFYFTRRRSR